MNPDRILQSDVLDIIFENRNKIYGAYELRTHYNARLKKAIVFTVTVAAMFIGLQYVKKSNGTIGTTNSINDTTTVKLIFVAEDKPKPQQTPAIKQKTIATATYKTVNIVPDDKVKDIPHTIADVLTTKIGTNDIKGENIGDKIVLPPSNGSLNGNNVVVKKDDAIDKPLLTAEIMPQFPGGIEALIKFLQQNLRQPDDLEGEEKLVVIANFIIDNTGNIQNIKIEQHARPDLDADVVRVLKRMPQWNAGIQNGRKVSVIYRLPVTFIAHD